MAGKIHLVQHIGVEELEYRYKAEPDGIRRSHLQIIWLLAQGRTAKFVASVTGYSPSWISTILWRYNDFSLEGLGDGRISNPGAGACQSMGDPGWFTALAVNRLVAAAPATSGMSMRIEIQLRIIGDDDSVISADEVLHLDKSDDRLEAVGLSFSDAKAVLAAIQERVVTAQAASFLARHRCCDRCDRALLSKGPGRIQFRTAFGTIPLNSPRFHRCRCQPSTSKTFSPLGELFTEHTAPELLYLETKWASLVSFDLTAQLLKEVLPIGSTANACTIRRHLHRVATRHETELGDGRPSGIEDTPADAWRGQVGHNPIIVGIDGGYLRNWYDKKRNFEVIVGKSRAAGLNDRYFGLVASQDEQSDRRLRAVLQDLARPWAVTMLTDGGDSVRALADELSPGAAPILDWFHIAMRLTGLGQSTRGLAHHNPIEATALETRLERNRGKNPGTLKSLTVLSNSRRVVRSLASCRKYRYRQATDPETKARIGSEYCLS
jgi:hypothetical protein